MDRPDAVHDILDELNITSLDDSDVDAGFQSFASDDAASTKGSFIEEPSTDSALSAEVRAALAAPLGDAATLAAIDSSSALERRLRMSSPASSVLPPQRLPDLQQQQLIRSVQSLADATAQMRHQSEVQDSSQRVVVQNPAADAATAVSLATATFRMQMSDLAVSEAQYLALRARPEDELNIREWIQVRFYEARSTHKAETERLRLEVEALRENVYSAQTRAERAERQLAQRDAKATDLTQELDRHNQVTRKTMDQMRFELQAREQEVAENKDKGHRFDALFQEAARLRDELQSLRDAMTSQSSAQQQLSREHAESSEKLVQLEGAHRLVQKDAEAHERRARMLEDSLARRDEEAAELREKVASLREKKRELARKATAEQTSVAHDVREQVDVEIKRFQDQARLDLEAVRTNLNALHEKEVQMLQERIAANDVRLAELQRRLDDEEHAHQELQLSAGRVRSDLQNEITELRGSLKLRAFEAERAILTHEEVSASRQQLEVENEQLRQQVDVLRKEYYTLEVQHREGRAAERAELASLKEQLKGYVEVERELDAAIRACSGVQTVMPDGSTCDELPPQSIDEALLIGTTLGGAPTSGQRRIQQSLLLAQEVQRRTREMLQCRAQAHELEGEVERLREELEASKREHHYASEPQAYLLEALRRREREVLDIRRNLREYEAELERSRKQVEQAVTARMQVEEELKQLLGQRQHLANLQAVLGSDGSPEATVKISHSGPGDQETLEIWGARAEHRGRKPSQQPQTLSQNRDTVGSRGPAWFQRLKGNLDGSKLSSDMK
jgi:chromosome segregation ATPase